MFVKQISVFIENKQGRLDKLLSVLGENGIDLIALSVADTTNFGMARAIVNDYEKAVAVLKENGYTAKLTDVLAAAVPDAPGGLASVLRALHGGGVSIEYLYTLMRRIGDDAVIILRVDAPEKAIALLREKGVKLAGQSEVCG